MHTKAAKSWNAWKWWTGERRDGVWLTPTMQKIRRYVLEYMNLKGAGCFYTYLEIVKKNIKMTGHEKRCICSSQGTSLGFLDRHHDALPFQVFSASELWYVFGGGFTSGGSQAKPISSGLRMQWFLTLGALWRPPYLRVSPSPSWHVCSKTLTILTRRVGLEQLNVSSVLSGLRELAVC